MEANVIIIVLTINCWLKRAVNGCMRDKYKYIYYCIDNDIQLEYFFFT